MNEVDYKYARALLGVARDKGKIEIFQNQFSDVIKIVKETKELEELLNSPTIGSRKKKEIIKNVFSGILEADFMNFILLLIDRERQERLSKIGELFIEMGNRERNIIKALVYTVEMLSEEEKNKLQQNLSRIFKKTVVIENIIDRDIIGGVKVKAGDIMLDGSIQGKLSRLKGLLERVKLNEIEVTRGYDT